MNPSTVTESQQQRLKQAIAAQDRGQGQEALKLLQGLLKENPQFAGAHAQAGLLMMAGKQYKVAEQHLLRVTQLLPEAPMGWRNLCAFYLLRKQWRAALVAAQRQLALAPQERIALRQVLQCQRETKQYKAALATLETLLKLEGSSTELQLFKGELLAFLDDLTGTLAAFQPLLADDSIPISKFEPWVRLSIRNERCAEAIDWLRRRLKLEPQSVPAHLMLCGALLPEGRYTEALEVLRAVEKFEPDNMRVQHDLGVVLRFLGRIQESQVHVGRALDKDPYHVSALRVYGAEHKYQYGDPVFSRLMRAAAQTSKYSNEARCQLHYALGKAFDDVGDPAVAFDHFIEAGRLRLLDHKDDEASMRLYHAVVGKRFTADALRKPEHAGSTSELPVFILGMPRSGTSLAEQVLASHPEVFGAGELKYTARVLDGIIVNGMRLEVHDRSPVFPRGSEPTWAQRGDAYVKYLKSCAPEGRSYSRIIDKMPGNYLWAGQINLILPKAKIIHTRRHPVETCLSAFRIFFPDGIWWSYDLKKMGHAYRQYTDIMNHWRAALPPGVMHEVRYEDMVNDLPTHAKQLVAHCGLQWDDACLNFHETDRPVRTASASQVRQPVYKTSMNRWRKYEPYLAPLLAELGPLVKAYEDELAAST